MIALGREDIPTQEIVTRDVAAPVDILVLLGAREVVTATVAKGVEVGNIPRVAATEMAKIVIVKEEEAVVVVVTVEREEVVMVVDAEDAVVPTETLCERVERMLRRSTEPPANRFSCTATISSCSSTSSGHCTSIESTFHPSVPVPA